MININRQLYSQIPSLEIYHYSRAGEVHTRDVSNLSYICWPDGSPCHLGNMFMISLTMKRGRYGRQGLSRKGSKGGTIRTYASKVTQLLRYCYLKNVGIYELSDSDFTEFITEIREEKKSRKLGKKDQEKSRRKSESTVTSVGRVCLEFLSFVGNLFEDANFIHPNGQIRAEQREYVPVKGSASNRIAKMYWPHHSLSSSTRKKTRQPIKKGSIECLRQAIHDMSTSVFIKHRRQCCITLLESIGARRGELSLLKVEDVLSAASLNASQLKLPTLKQEDDSFRMIPIPKVLLPGLLLYIRVYRRKVLRETVGLKNDDGYFFISATTGKRISEETLTKELSVLRIKANIEEQACSHMFRHAFVTNLFCLFIERNEFENEDKFRQQLIGSETFKSEIQQWTGHASPQSLDRYIHAAFAKRANYSKTLSSVAIIQAQEAFDRIHDELIRQVESNDLSFAEFKKEFHELRELRNRDFDAAENEM